jgi:hypothetical protein
MDRQTGGQELGAGDCDVNPGQIDVSLSRETGKIRNRRPLRPATVLAEQQVEGVVDLGRFDGAYDRLGDVAGPVAPTEDI